MQYEIHVGSADHIGMGMMESVIEMAALGAKLKPGTVPFMRFPFATTLILEADQPPMPKASMRVFEVESKKEIHAHMLLAKQETSGFSLDVDEGPKVDLSLNGDKPWTKEQLEEMDFDNEFKPVMAAAGIAGKKRALMMNKYLAKHAGGSEVVESTESEEETE